MYYNTIYPRKYGILFFSTLQHDIIRKKIGIRGGGDLNKKLKIVLRCLLISIVAAIIVFKLWESGAFIFDCSANVSSNYVEWKGKEYSITCGQYTEGRTIAKGKIPKMMMVRRNRIL